MDYLARYDTRDNRRFGVALAVSLLAHVLALVIKIEKPEATAREPRDTRLDVTLAPERETVTPPPPVPPPASATPREERRPKVLAVPPRHERAPVWTQAQRDDMDNFLNELTPQPALRGRELAQRAFEMAGRMAPRLPPDDEIEEMKHKFAAAKVDPFSIELYFDALFKKLNRSAAMVPPERRQRGTRVAAVRVVVDQSGALKDFRVLWAADQQSEIDFIREVVQHAAPFPVFPEDIRNATDSIVLQICIIPGNSGSGATFSRMAPGNSCRAE